MTQTYLLNEYPLIVLPTLAGAVGVHEAIVLQQINFWINNPKIGKMHDGLRWVRNSIEEWQEDNFPFLSVSTLKRIFNSLEDKHLIFKENLNDNPYDKTLWYTINKPEILRIVSEYQLDTIEKARLKQSTLGQIDTIGSVIVTPSLSDNTSDNTSSTPPAAYQLDKNSHAARRLAHASTVPPLGVTEEQKAAEQRQPQSELEAYLAKIAKCRNGVLPYRLVEKISTPIRVSDNEYDSPARMYYTDELFRRWLEERIVWAMDNTDMSAKTLVSMACLYDTPKYGWLDYEAYNRKSDTGRPDTSDIPDAPSNF